MLKPPFSNCRIITAIILGIPIFRIFNCQVKHTSSPFKISIYFKNSFSFIFFYKSNYCSFINIIKSVYQTLHPMKLITAALKMNDINCSPFNIVQKHVLCVLSCHESPSNKSFLFSSFLISSPEPKAHKVSL